MPSFRPTRRQLLAALGASGVAGLGAATTGAVTVEGVSPAWRAWRSRLEQPERSMAGTEERVFAVRDAELLVFSRNDGSPISNAALSTEHHALAGVTTGAGRCYSGVGELRAFSLRGEARWRIEPQGRIGLTAAPVVTDGTVVGGFQGGETDEATLLAATTDGDRVWRTDLPGNLADVTADTNGVYARTGGPGDIPDRLFAVDPASGEIRWTRTKELPTIPGGISAGDGIVAIAGRGVLALDAETGRERWRQEDERLVAATVADGLVMAVGDAVRAFDARSGEGAWGSRLRGKGHAYLPPVPHADGFLVTDRGAHGLQAIGPDGQHRWWLSLNVPPKNGIGTLTRPVPGDPHVVGADDQLVGVAERPI